MPGRTVILANDEAYHVFNKGIASQPTFITKRDYQRAIDTLFYYQNSTPLLRYAKFMELPSSQRMELLNDLKKSKKWLVEIICYCIMPNHFHLLLRQIENDGISKLMSNFANSYTRYFNVKRKINGPIFQGRFKAVRIETEEQLLHVSRYIHLNPYTGYLVKTYDDLEAYNFSSFPEYIGIYKTTLCSKDLIMSNFKENSHYKKFVFDNGDYQRELANLKHLTFE